MGLPWRGLWDTFIWWCCLSRHTSTHSFPHTPSPRTHPTACVTEPVRKWFVLAPLFDQNSNFIYAVHMSHRFLQNPCASQFDRLDFWILLVYLQEFAYHASGPTKLWEKCTKICGKRVNARQNVRENPRVDCSPVRWLDAAWSIYPPACIANPSQAFNSTPQPFS